MGIEPAQRVGLAAFRAVGVEQEIVKVPKSQVVAALGRPQPVAAGGVKPEKDLAIHQQSEKLVARKAVLPPQPADFLRLGQHGDSGRNLRIANSKQRAGARRFQNHLIAAPPQVSEPRQNDSLGSAELWRSRPIIGNLRFDDDLILIVAQVPEAVFQETMPG